MAKLGSMLWLVLLLVVMLPSFASAQNETVVVEYVATPLPLGGLADPRGLWTATMVGTIITGDPIFATAGFALIHFIDIVPVLEASTMGPAMIYELAVHMLIFAVFGTFAGWMLLVAMGNPVLIPTHHVENSSQVVGRVYTPATWFVLLSIVFLVKSFLVFTQLYYLRFDYGVGDLGKGAHITWNIVLFIALLILAAVIVVFTWIGKQSWLTIRYYGTTPNGLDGQRIVVYGLLLALVLAPQAIADFAGSPDGPLPMWGAGLIALLVELIVWTILFFALRYFWSVDQMEFGEKSSGVTWMEFVVIVASVMFVTGLIYFLVVGLALTTFEQMEWTLMGLTALVGLVALFVGVWPWPLWKYRRQEVFETKQKTERRKGQKRRNQGRGESVTLAVNPDVFDLRNNVGN